MEPLKNVYNDQFFKIFTDAIVQSKSDFATTAFMKTIYDDSWKNLELKERMRHISTTLRRYFPDSFKESCVLILQVIENLKTNGLKDGGFEYMFLPDFIEIYGIDDFETSISTMEEITKFVSCEFAVRPFLKEFPDKMTTQMHRWADHNHAMVRRLATEGFRPRLPWGMGIPRLKKDPAPILLILEKLKNDDSESVRRSVANNLNDISKDHSDLAIQLSKKWIGKTPETDWVVKHACRTLLKAGNQEVMQLFGFGSIEEIEITGFEVITPNVEFGEQLIFQFNLNVKSTNSIKIRLEYGIYYLKANGSLSRKVFKISEKEYAANSMTTIEKKQSFKIISTRKFYVGSHEVSLIINGIEVEKLPFELTN